MTRIESYIHDRFVVHPSPTIDTFREAFTQAAQLVKKENPGKKLVLISGKVTASTPEGLKANEAILRTIATQRENTHPNEICITSAQIMPLIREKLTASMPIIKAERDAEFVSLWGFFVTAGVIDLVVMNTNWRDSTGATKEHEAALIKKIPIEYMQTSKTTTEKLYGLIAPLRRTLRIASPT